MIRPRPNTSGSCRVALSCKIYIHTAVRSTRKSANGRGEASLEGCHYGGLLGLNHDFSNKTFYGLSEEPVLKERKYHSEIISNSVLDHFFKLLVNFSILIMGMADGSDGSAGRVWWTGQKT